MVENNQNILLNNLHDLLQFYYEKGVFSASAIDFYTPLYARSRSCLVTYGVVEEESSESIGRDYLFDLASLTKPLVTLLSVLILIEKKKISWDEPLESLLECRIPEPLQDIDLTSLLSHSSGLPAHRNYWKNYPYTVGKKKKNVLKKLILREIAEYKKGERHIYSDLGYMLLGFIVELKAKKGLDRYWYKHIADPLGLRDNLHFPVSYKKPENGRYVATGSCPWSGRQLKGIVHDDNCRLYGEICGHAGLFGTASAVLVLCREFMLLLRGEKSRLNISSDVFAQACLQVGASEWTAGFNRRSDQHSSSGDYFSSQSIGHLGFTGTSFWVDPEQEIIIVFLTNRVIKGEDQKGIKKLRPEIHNMIVEHLRTER